MAKYNTNLIIGKLEKYIDFWDRAQKMGAGNILPTSQNLNFDIEISTSKYQDFISFGDYHYFIGRIIFTKGGGVYGFFCAHQCIELYLKAYIIFKRGNLKKLLIHDLHKLLEYCRGIAPNKSFLHTKRAELIITRFDPFYELPRYPVSRRGIKGGSYVYLQPDDIYPLDYFIFRIRKEMPLPTGNWDILGDGRPYGAASLAREDPLVEYFKFNNINY